MKKRSGLQQSLRQMSVKAEKALKVAVAKTIEDHRKTGDPLAIWQDGKVIWVPAAKAKRILKAS